MSIYLSDEQGRLKKVADDLPIVTKGIDAQLNSESTNPVQNKVLYEPVTFAESERHKGKNLFDFDRILYNGTAFDKKQQIVKVHTNSHMTTTTENWLVEFADLEIGGTYHLHFETTSPEADYITFNGSLKRVDNDTTFTVTKEDLLGTVSFYTVERTTSTVSEIIIEAGDKFTGYCPYYGKLLREGDKVSRYLKQQYLECNKNLFYTDSKKISFTKTSYTDWFDVSNSTWLGSAEGYGSIRLKNNREDNSTLTVDTRGVDYGTYNAYEFRTGDLGANFSIKMYRLDPDTEYTLSFYTDWVNNDVTFFDIECSSVENTDFKSITFTTSSEGSYEFVNGFVCDAPNTLVMIRDIILEKGPVFTGYTYPVGRPLYALDLERYNNTLTTTLGNNLNLFEVNTVVRGYSLSSATGENISDALWYVSDYIDVQGLSSVIISGYRDSGQSNCFYDANKTFISTYKAITGYVPVPSNAVYMRINGLISQLGKGYTNISQEDLIHNNVIQGMAGVVLWENPNKKAAFVPQVITLSNSLANFDYCALEYETVVPSSEQINCRQYSYFRPIVGGNVENLQGGWDSNTRYIKARAFKILTETTIDIYTGWQEDVINDRMMVPLRIIGYKKGV